MTIYKSLSYKTLIDYLEKFDVCYYSYYRDVFINDVLIEHDVMSLNDEEQEILFLKMDARDYLDKVYVLKEEFNSLYDLIMDDNFIKINRRDKV